MFKLSFDTDNAAFEDDPRPEVARILRNLEAKVWEWEGYGKFQNIYDSNGNTIGTWKLNPEEER